MFHRLYYLAKHALDHFDGLIHWTDKLNNVEVHSMAMLEEFHYHRQWFLFLLLHRKINAELSEWVEEKAL